MNIKRELIALAIRVLANETSLVRKPEPFEALINHMFGGESYDQQMARNIEVELDRVTTVAKRANLNRKFNKIVHSIDLTEESP